MANRSFVRRTGQPQGVGWTLVRQQPSHAFEHVRLAPAAAGLLVQGHALGVQRSGPRTIPGRRGDPAEDGQ